MDRQVDNNDEKAKELSMQDMLQLFLRTQQEANQKFAENQAVISTSQTLVSQNQALISQNQTAISDTGFS